MISKHKEFRTFQEQLEILKSRGFLISIDEEQIVLHALQSINYYRLMGYALPFKIDKNQYASVPFTNVLKLYQWDTDLRHLMLKKIEQIEIFFRTIFSYTLSNQDEYFHTNLSLWKDGKSHRKWMSHIKLDKRKLPVQHYNNNVDEMPLWVLIEYLTFGSLTALFASVTIDNQKLILNNLHLQNLYTPKEFYGFINLIRELRNYCSHFDRIFDTEFTYENSYKKNHKTIVTMRIKKLNYEIDQLFRSKMFAYKSYGKELTIIQKEIRKVLG